MSETLSDTPTGGEIRRRFAPWWLGGLLAVVNLGQGWLSQQAAADHSEASQAAAAASHAAALEFRRLEADCVSIETIEAIVRIAQSRPPER